MQLQSLLSLSTAFTTLLSVKAAVVAPTHLALNPKPTDLSNVPTWSNGHEHSLRLPPHDPFIWYLNGTTLALEFYKYGEEVDSRTLLFCYTMTEFYIDIHTLDYGDGPIPADTPPNCLIQNGGYDMQLSPGTNFSTLKHVVLGLESFHRKYGYFATRFKIYGGPKREIGSGEIFQIQPSTPSNASLTVIQPPPVPFLFPIPYSSYALGLKFTAFGKPIAGDDMTDVYIDAALYLAEVLPKHGDTPIPRHFPLQWSNGNASLTIEHEPNMRFGHLAEVVRGLQAFQEKYGYTAASYQILRQGEKSAVIGSGDIAAVKKS